MTTFQLLGIQFGVSESTANDTFNYWLTILQEILPSSLLEQVKKNASDYEIVQEVLTDYELIVDSSEQLRERPREYQERSLPGEASPGELLAGLLLWKEEKSYI